MKVSDADIIERLVEYRRALRDETDASPTVREAWKKLCVMLDELMMRRASER